MKISLLNVLLFVTTAQFSYAQCWKTIACGEQHCMGIQPDGTLWGWGGNTVGEIGFVGPLGNKDFVTQIGTESNWDTLSVGAYHSLALKSDGTLWATGFNMQGQVGTGNTSGGELNFVQIGTANDWVYISAGDYNSFAIKNDGTLWACGKNSGNELGDGSTTDQTNLIQIGTDTNWKSVAAGYSHTLAIKTNNTLWSWGTNVSGETGIAASSGSSTPQQVGSDMNWSVVSAGTNYSIGIKTDGSLYGWGSNYLGKAGLNSAINSYTPVQISNDLNWKTVNAGFNHTLALKSDNTLWAWGSNNYSQSSGNFGIVDIYVPTQIGTDADWKNIASGLYSSHTVKNNGNMWSWGGESRGQLANGPVSGSTGLITEVEVCLSNELETLENSTVTVYPNPTQGIITIKSKGELDYNLLSSNGVVLKRGKMDATIQLNLEEYSSGIYFLQIENGQTLLISKN